MFFSEWGPGSPMRVRLKISTSDVLFLKSIFRILYVKILLYAQCNFQLFISVDIYVSHKCV